MSAYDGAGPQLSMDEWRASLDVEFRKRCEQSEVFNFGATGISYCFANVTHLSAPTEERIYVEDPFGNRLALIEPASGLIESAGSHRAWWTITRTACTSPPD
jgi:hypothetical protein